MQEEWYKIAEFPHYSISSEGRVRNDRFQRVVKVSITSQGALKVGLVGPDKKQYTRSIKLLVAEAFVPGRDEIFDTPIHLDGDQANVHASNLMWRPRWFAIKYALQFETIGHYSKTPPVIDLTTGLVYKNVADAGMAQGLLFQTISLAIVENKDVFPANHAFGWLKEFSE